MTNRFILTIGINQGYFHENKNGEYSVSDIGQLFNEMSQHYFEKNNIYVSFTIGEGKTFYSTSWGCPSEGEDTVVISGVCNTEFSDILKWKNAVLYLSCELKKKLLQTTCTVEFVSCELHYLK